MKTKIKWWLEKVSGFLFYPINYLLRIKKLEKIIMSGLFKTYDCDKVFQYICISCKEKKLPKYYFDDCCIIMQGPIIYDKNYTINTLKYYRKIYPNITIVLSTSDSIIHNNFYNLCKDINVIISQNSIDLLPGYGHVNYQVRNTLLGLNLVKKNYKIRYAMKCRTDQRVYKPNFLEYFKLLLTTFPIKDNTLNNRIIFIGARNSYINIPFHISDFLTFGTFEDISKLYTIPNSNIQHKNKLASYGILSKVRNSIGYFELFNNNKFNSNRWNRIIDKFINAEIHIVKSFYSVYIEPIDKNNLLKQYYKFLAKFCIIVDVDDLYLHWNKYIYKYNRASIFEQNRGNLNFSEWLKIYLQYKDLDI